MRSGHPVTRRPEWTAVTTIGIVAAITVVYYLLPEPGRMREASWGAMFGLGTAALGAAILLSIRRLLRVDVEQRTTALIVLLCITVLFFSYMDAVVAEIPGQFYDMHNKTDAVYFSVSTLATVGFGDVHPSGQLARIAVTLQIIFNLVFIGSAAATVAGLWRARATRRVHEHHGDATGGRESGAHGHSSAGREEPHAGPESAAGPGPAGG
jgi:voltage-gated potassium channel